MDLAPAPVSPLFALVDCNNFYVSCERAFQPQLNGKPVVVLSNNDGCIISRSAEAKTLGVRMGIPWHEARPYLAEGLIALSSNYALYGDLSARVMNILGDMAPRQEIYSIDETFLDLSGVTAPEKLALAMRRRVLQWAHIPTCVGLGSTRTRAKLANHIAKKARDGNGVFNLEALSPEDEQTLLASLPVGEVWGVGLRWQEKLQRLRIRTVADLCAADADWLRAQSNVVLARTVKDLQGVSCLSLEDVAEPQQQLMHSRSFGHPVTELRHLEEAVHDFITTAAAKLRQRGLQTAMMSVSIQTYTHRGPETQYRNSAALPLPAPTQDSRVLAQLAREGLHRIFRPGFRYKKAGVLLTALSGVEQRQLDWLNPGDSERSRALMAAVDGINRGMGRNAVRWGLPTDAGHWRMRQERRSPGFTSAWGELKVVKA
jgi:DNA polymerase V